MANVKGKGRLSEILGTGAHRRPTHYRSSARLTHAERRARKTVVDLSAMPERVDQQAELDAAVLAGIKHRDSVLVDKRRRATNRRFMDQGGGNDYYERVWDAASPRERQIARSHFDTTLLRKCLAGQQKGAKFPTSKAPISAVFHSFRLIFGRAIIFWSGLAACLVAWHMQAVHDNIERHERELNAILKHHQIHLYGQKDKKYLMVQSSFAWKIMVHHNRRVRAPAAAPRARGQAAAAPEEPRPRRLPQDGQIAQIVADAARAR
ncbi:hypothetical protein JL720_15392 [Aureococcus anophagefferens]|nr:hypothetical protein JL720_15392 [Aureococcus anophagefferens]